MPVPGPDAAHYASRSASNALLADDLFIFAMRPDPEPHKRVRSLDSDRSMMQPDPSRPEAPHLLEVN